MIWLCGDIHGDLDFDKVEEFFEYAVCYDDITKADYLIILGDVGVCWDGVWTDEIVRELLRNLPCTVLWIDGNHENFELLNEYPVEDWHGGKVQFIEEDIIHLMRGQVYEIEGKTFFTFGGASSVDKHMRTPGQNWWTGEMPSADEYEEGMCNLERAGYKVDYILSHTCPQSVAKRLVSKENYGEEELREYFEKIAKMTNFDRWYFGHWHKDCAVDKFRCLWQEIVDIE